MRTFIVLAPLITCQLVVVHALVPKVAKPPRPPITLLVPKAGGTIGREQSLNPLTGSFITYWAGSLSQRSRSLMVRGLFPSLACLRRTDSARAH